MAELDEVHKRLRAIAETVNAFKSEAVQLRIVEVLLAEVGVADPAPEKQRKMAKTRKRPSRKSSKSVAGDGSAPAKTAKKPRATGSPGAFVMISDLLAAGFFKTPKTIGAIIEHAGQARGHHYKPNECSTPLLRLLRDGKLKRQKNKDGQYEYTKA